MDLHLMLLPVYKVTNYEQQCRGDAVKNVVLIGFMGTGKTSTGRLLASRLGRPFVDIDRKFELECNMTVAEYFKLHGETAFRQKEKAIIAKVSRYSFSVIATGGGSVLDPDNFNKLKANGIIVSLTASVDTIVERTGRRKGVRPLLDCENPREKVAALLEQRVNIYQKADFIIDTSILSPHQVAERIIVFLRQSGYLKGKS